MPEVTEADVAKAAMALNYGAGEQVSPMDQEYVEQIAAALAEEREAERLQWNPMVGRVIQVAMEWTASGDPKLAECAQRIHAAIGGVQ